MPEIYERILILGSANTGRILWVWYGVVRQGMVWPSGPWGLKVPQG